MELVPIVVMRRRYVIRYPRYPSNPPAFECCNARSNYKELKRGWKCEVCGKVWNLPPKVGL